MSKPLETIKVSAGEDLLAFIPHMVGYWPESSVVCIGMMGKKLQATMRLDLPPEDADARDTERFATIAATQLANDKTSDGCLIAIFGRRDWPHPKDQPYAKLFKAFRKAFADRGLPVRDAWYVGKENWRSLTCSDARCCPWPGKSNLSIRESFVNAEFVFRGSMIGEAPKEQVRQLTAVRDVDFVAAVVAAGEQSRGPLGRNGCGHDQLTATLQAWQFSVELWPKPPDAHMCAFLLASLADSTVRDCVIMLLATSGEYALAGAVGLWLSGSDTEDTAYPLNWYGGNQAAGKPLRMEWATEELIQEAAYDFSSFLVGSTAPRIPGEQPHLLDWERLDGAEPFLHFLARASDSPEKAPVLCILGWIQWCKGRGSWAGEYFQACLAHQPGYRLASLLDQLLSAGHVADCAKDRTTAWRREEQLQESDRDEAA
ncbi:hypothetical protein AS189_13945 [Arthrobacter alpinus]|uniref:DUF4192 domain-containing protein n=1 Tax=Arthrobacter alpinus TaxID=656366 RepID=A0A0S2M0Y5_9MICC|nr:DUF4192 domain-containing protein [Arthrobacter alpinus]ALO67389.1 hypothetical protein AS189_13945 [Arthrobacter alpinus]